jgi:excisionase family DNA binding protein
MLFSKHLLSSDTSSAPLLIDEREAARLLGIALRTLWGLRKAGCIPCVRIGRAVRYRVADLQAFIDQHREVKNGKH